MDENRKTSLGQTKEGQLIRGGLARIDDIFVPGLGESQRMEIGDGALLDILRVQEERRCQSTLQGEVGGLQGIRGIAKEPLLHTADDLRDTLFCLTCRDLQFLDLPGRGRRDLHRWSGGTGAVPLERGLLLERLALATSEPGTGEIAWQFHLTQRGHAGLDTAGDEAPLPRASGDPPGLADFLERVLDRTARDVPPFRQLSLSGEPVARHEFSSIDPT